MTYPTNNAISQPFKGNSKSSKAPVEHRSEQDSSVLLDGSLTGLNGVLSELVEIVGQDNDAHTAPVLEIQFGDICTLTSAQKIQNKVCLSVTVLLPRHEKADCSSVEAVKRYVLLGADKNWECLWHADNGHNVLVHNIPANELSDECGIMDAIIESAEQATLWFAMHCAGATGRA